MPIVSFSWPKVAVYIATGALLGWWLALPETVQALVWLMAVDIATGVAAAWVQGALQSAIAMRGLAKKLIVLLLLIAAGQLDPYTELALVDMGAAGFIGVEVLSILENAGRAGVPLPERFRAALAALGQTPKEG